MSLGYSENIWKTHIGLLVETECRRNLEGNFKVSLQGIYGEYVDILKVFILFLIIQLSGFLTFSPPSCARLRTAALRWDL